MSDIGPSWSYCFSVLLTPQYDLMKSLLGVPNDVYDTFLPAPPYSLMKSLLGDPYDVRDSDFAWTSVYSDQSLC